MRWTTILMCLLMAGVCAVSLVWAKGSADKKQKGDAGSGDEAQGPREGRIILEGDQDKPQDEKAEVRVKGTVRRVRKTSNGHLVSFVLAAKSGKGEPQDLTIRVTGATRYRQGDEKADSGIVREGRALEVVLRAEPRGGRGTAVVVIARADRSEGHEKDASPKERSKP